MIPKHTAPDALSVSDGAATVGYVVERNGSFFSFDDSGTLLGEFKTQRAAVRSIPPTVASKEGVSKARKARGE